MNAPLLGRMGVETMRSMPTAGYRYADISPEQALKQYQSIPVLLSTLMDWRNIALSLFAIL